MLEKKCLNCNSIRQKVLYTMVRNSIPYFFSICQDCSYIFQTNRYEKEFYHSLPVDEPEKYLKHAIRRSKYIKNFCKNFIENRLFTSIFDIGCGRGGILKTLKTFYYPGAQYYGVTLPIDKFKKKYFKDNDGYIFYSDIEEYFNRQDYLKYDWIIMSHVLEHFFDPKQTLKNIVEHLMGDSSIIYIEVPSFYWGGIRTNPIFSPVHLSYFIPETLGVLLDECNLKILKIKESKYWGNIKVIAEKQSMKKFPVVSDWRTILKKNRTIKVFGYPYYKLKKNFITIGEND